MTDEALKFLKGMRPLLLFANVVYAFFSAAILGLLFAAGEFDLLTLIITLTFFFNFCYVFFAKLEGV